MDKSDYKHMKEEFVSNHSGTTKWEIYCLITCLPFTFLLAVMVQQKVQLLFPSLSEHKASRLVRFLLEFALVVTPSVALCMSLAPVEPTFTLGLLLWGAYVAKRALRRSKTAQATHQLALLVQQLAEQRKPYTSAFRGGLMLYTCISILAVDFHAFPRRYAKAERYGTGLMDVGVGMIIFAGGLVSKAAQQDLRSRVPLARRLRQGLRSAAPALALGLARLLATRAAGYHEHVGEYGAHWNFFLTVATVGLLAQLLPLPSRSLGPAGALLALLHQAALSLGGLSIWVHSESRGPGLMSQNKEGLGSLPGYLSLYLLGAATGQFLRRSGHTALAKVKASLEASTKGSGKGRPSTRPLWLWVVQLGLADTVLWLAAELVPPLVEPVSRRACNLAYVLWISALCLSLLFMCLVTQLVTPPAQGLPQLLGAANRNMLAVFLAANVLTGAVNMGIDTLAVGDEAARWLVCVYMLLVCLVGSGLDWLNVTLKL